MGRGQARSVADGAVGIDRFSAGATNQVMVVVADTILVTSRRTGWLNTPDDALLGQDSQRVVHRLPRYGTDFGASLLGNVVRRAMWPIRHRPQHCQSLSRDLDAVFVKDLGEIVIHALMLKICFDSVNK